MRFALLGSGTDLWRVASAIQRSTDHQLVAAADAPGLPAEYPVAHVDWLSLLDPQVAEALVVGRGGQPELRAEQLRKLVQAAVPMILVHPACDTITAFELDMIRQDSHCIMIPYGPGLIHPAIELLRQWVGQGERSPLGVIEQLIVTRCLSDRQRESVLDQFSRDLLLVRSVLGDITQLSAMGPTAGDLHYSNLGVQMYGAGRVLARWTAEPADDQVAGRLSLIGVAGKATIELAEDDSAWKCSIPGQPTPVWPPGECGVPARVLDRLVQAMGGQVERPSWDDACRASDLADVVDISLRRARAIQLHNPSCTEQDTFKSIMAVGGCGVLLFSLLAVVLLALIEALDLAVLDHPLWQQFPWRLLSWRNWPLVLLGLLVLFLLLQLLRLVARGPGTSAPHSAAGQTPPEP